MFKKQKAMLDEQKAHVKARTKAWWDEAVEAADRPSEADKVGVGMTYVCWFFGGLVGAHRIWMGRRFWPTLLYACTGGYFLFGWAWDFITIPAQVKQINRKIDKAIAKHKAEIAKQKAKAAPNG